MIAAHAGAIQPVGAVADEATAQPPATPTGAASATAPPDPRQALALLKYGIYIGLALVVFALARGSSRKW